MMAASNIFRLKCGMILPLCTMLAYSWGDACPEVNSSPQIEPRYLASAQPKTDWGISFFGDYLYWAVKEEGLVYGLQATLTDSPYQTIFGNPSKIDPGFNSGMRIGIDYNLPNHDLDIAFTWTRYHNAAKDSISPKPNKETWVYWVNDSGELTANGKTSADWDLHLNAYDLELGCAFFPKKYLSLRPFIGVRAAWIEQKLEVLYTDLGFAPLTTIQFESYIRSRNYNNFQGYGMRVGLDTKWILGKGFSLLGDLAGSLLWSDFSIAQFEKNSFGYPRSKVREQAEMLTSVAEMFGGVQWETSLHDDAVDLNFYAGWEMQIWFNQNQFNNFPERHNTGYAVKQEGDLTLFGLTLGASVGF